MDAFSKSVYTSEISRQCQFAINAIGQLNHALKSLPEARDSSTKRQFFHSEVFRSVHSFLTHASNISRLLWPALPSRGNGESDQAYEARIALKTPVARARALRGAFSLPEEHALRSRRLRDMLEHFDEKLDEWRITSAQKNIVNDYIGRKQGFVGIAATDMMRWFDPTTKCFTFRGETFDLQLLATSVDELLPVCTSVEQRLREEIQSEVLASHNKSLKPTPQGGAA